MVIECKQMHIIKKINLQKKCISPGFSEWKFRILSSTDTPRNEYVLDSNGSLVHSLQVQHVYTFCLDCNHPSGKKYKEEHPDLKTA